MGFNGQSAASTGMTMGLQAGLATGNPLVGLAVGGAGALMGGLMGGGGSQASPDMAGAYGMYKGRESEIDAFEKELSSANAGFANALNNFYSYSMSQFGPNSIPYFASHGIQAQGGAFQAELARQAAGYNAQMQPQIWQQTIQNAHMVDQARSGAYQGMAGMMAGAGMAQYAAQNQADLLSGQASGNMLAGGLSNAMNMWQSGKTPALNWGFGGGSPAGVAGYNPNVAPASFPGMNSAPGPWAPNSGGYNFGANQAGFDFAS